MKKYKILTITAILLALTIGNTTMAAPVSTTTPKVQSTAQIPTEFRVAIVDIQKVVESSPSINALNVDRKNKINDLTKFVEDARADVAKETDANKKKTLEDKYNKELNDKKNAIDKAYAKKLSDIDKEITALIKLKTSDYNLVLPKSGVLRGGVDLTSEIIKGLK